MPFQTKENGFTLVEILIAVVILGIAFLSISMGMQKTNSVTWQTQERAIAINLAREQLELLKRYDNSGTTPVLTDTSKTIRGKTYQVSFTNLTGSGIFNSTNITPIRITISWRSHTKDFSLPIETCYLKSY